MLWHVHGHQKITCDTSESFPPFSGERDVLCGHKKKWSFYVFDSFYENWHGSSQDKYFFMGSFLATQIDPGATIYNLRVQLWQGWWGYRPLYMWILVQKNEFFCEKCPENCHLKAGRVYKPVFIKIWSISSKEVYLGRTRPPKKWCLNWRF